MPIDVIRGTTRKEVSSAALIECIEQKPDLSGVLFIGYPIIATASGPYLVDALLVSGHIGIVIFDLVEGTDLGNHEERQDDAANKLEAKLKSHSELMRRRDLAIPIKPISFAPALASHSLSDGTDDYPLTNREKLVDYLLSLRWPGKSDKMFLSALSAIENISTIRHGRTQRTADKDDSRGAKLTRLEAAIATLDPEQGKAVIETVDGIQRIRGLAGSGKTIVLALKAAYLHAYNPDWRIAVTFNTRSLKGQFQRFINTFCLAQVGVEPDWERLRVVNAWGAPGRPDRDGMYYEFCRVHDVDYLDFGRARAQYGMDSAFAQACRLALQQATDKAPVYDAILVDEAQDFSPDFLQICHRLLGLQKRLIYAYDELQSLTGSSLPAPEQIFGDDHRALSNDIVLQRCYRNSRPVLATAHALGFGIYRKPRKEGEIGIVQMFDQPRLWEDIGYQRKSGDLQPGCSVALARTLETSPRFLEKHSQIDDLVQFISFASTTEQAEWLAKEIGRNLSGDELRPDDIMVINPDPISTRKQVGPIRRRLLDAGIQCHLAGVDTASDVFGGDLDSVTFTGIHRAKGNEAAMVYIINAQDCYAARFNLAQIRNRLFTAITRSKAWIRVLGVGDAMEGLIEEFRELKSRDFELQFTYPTQEQRDYLRIVHRDMSQQERNQVSTSDDDLSKLISRLDTGMIHITDLDQEMIMKLKHHLQSS